MKLAALGNIVSLCPSSALWSKAIHKSEFLQRQPSQRKDHIASTYPLAFFRI
jgi:hypothetical protein